MNPRTLGELKAEIKRYSHRSDLDSNLHDFINRTSERLGRRFGVMPGALVNENDTNSLLTHHPGLYIYGAMRELAIFTADLDATRHYEDLFQEQVRQMNINYHGADWDSCDPPVVCPGEPCRG